MNFNITHKKGGFRPHAYSDAHSGNNRNDGKVTSSYITTTYNGPVTLKMRIMQEFTAQSTMEAELVAGVLITKNAGFLPAHDDVAGLEGKIIFRMDKIPALRAAGNQTYSSRPKHVALTYFHTRDITKKTQRHSPHTNQIFSINSGISS